MNVLQCTCTLIVISYSALELSKIRILDRNHNTNKISRVVVLTVYLNIGTLSLIYLLIESHQL